MDAESRKSFRHGFILKEADLRRVADTVGEQFRKLLPDTSTTQRFRLKFRNGVIAETASIDEVLGQENSGSGKIIRLFYEQKTSETNQPTHVSVEFTNVDIDDEPGLVSARYSVFGHDRDWVFVTSSLLEERIDKVKRFAPNQLAGGKTADSRLAFRLFGLLVPMLVLLGGLLLGASSIGRTFQEAHNVFVGQLETRWKAGSLTDPVEAILLVERERAEERNLDPWKLFSVRPLAYVIAVLVALGGLLLFLVRYYPVFNFCWGEYLDDFNKREAARQFWLVVIVVGVVVSFVGSLLANSLGFLQ